MQRPDLRQGQDVKQLFFSERNHSTLETILLQDFKERYDLTLNPAQEQRLSKTLDHYIGEVYQKQGNKPIQALNKEVYGTQRIHQGQKSSQTSDGSNPI
jgi:hypothetical protein